MEHLPATLEDDRTVVALRDGTPPTSMAEAFATLSDGLQNAAGQMDDVLLEVDASCDRLRVRFRAYRHRDNG